jgi:hypothetical protein
VYQRNSVPLLHQDLTKKEPYEFNSIHSNTFLSQESQPTKEIPKQSRTVFHKRSKTPNISSKSAILSFKIFEDFLNNLEEHKSNIPEVLVARSNTISKALSDHFTRNPTFSMDLYLSITDILKYIKDPKQVDPSVLSQKIKEASIHLPSTSKTFNLKTCTEKLNLKVINVKNTQALKRSLSTNEPTTNLFNAFLVLFTEVDKSYEKIPLKKLQPIKTCQIMQKVLQTPGKLIQTCRKFQEFQENFEISENNAKFAEGLLKTVEDQIEDLEFSAELRIFYEFLMACVQSFQSDVLFMSQISLMRNSSQENLDSTEKYSKLDEALELSKELLKKSPKTSTPLKEQHKKMLRKTLETKLSSFLSQSSDENLENPVTRVMIFERFERSVLQEIRSLLLSKFSVDSKFLQEVIN